MRLPRFPAAACSSLLHRDSELIVAKLAEQGGVHEYDMSFAPIHCLLLRCRDARLGGTAWLRPWARQRHIIIMPIMMIAAQPFIIIRDLCLNENLPPFGRRACGGQWLSRCTLIMIMITVTVTPTLNLKCRYNSDSGSESEST